MEREQNEQGAQTVALRIIAGLMVVGASSMLAVLIVPFVLALVLAIALSPAADWIERKLGVGRALSSLAGTLFIASALATAAGLIGYQAGTILQDSNKYIDRFGKLLAQGSKHLGGDRLMASFGILEREDSDRGRSGPSGSGGEAGGRGESPRGDAQDKDEDKSKGQDQDQGARAQTWITYIERNAQALGRWVLTGIGGMVGFLGGVVIFLAFLFYMLQTRGDWIDRITLAARRLGLRPTAEKLERVRHEIVMFIGCLSMVSLGYVVIVSLALWAIGVPQPLLWGVLAGLMEVVPYFGPLIAALLPTIVSFSPGPRLAAGRDGGPLRRAAHDRGLRRHAPALRAGRQVRPGLDPPGRDVLRMALGPARARGGHAGDDPPAGPPRHLARHPRPRRPGRGTSPGEGLETSARTKTRTRTRLSPSPKWKGWKTDPQMTQIDTDEKF